MRILIWSRRKEKGFYKRRERERGVNDRDNLKGSVERKNRVVEKRGGGGNGKTEGVEERENKVQKRGEEKR